MQAEDGVDAAFLELGHQGVGAEVAVADEHVAFFQKVADALPQAQVVTAPIRERMTKPCAGRERQKTPSILATGKPQTFFWVRGWGHCFWFSFVSDMEKLVFGFVSKPS